jgi:rhodanese-related sulfurtransferase
MKRNNYKSRVTYVSLISLLVGVVVGCFVVYSADSLRYTSHIPAKTVEMNPKEVYLFTGAKKSQYVFLDVRTVGEYKRLHALNSTSTPIGHLFDDRNTLPRDKKTTIFLICTTGRLASVAYGYLQLQGFTNIVHVNGGLVEWVKQGLPVNTSNILVDPDFSLDKEVSH